MGCAGRGGVTCASAASSAWDSAGPKPWRAGGATTPSVATRSPARLVRSSEAGAGQDVVCASHVRGGPQPATSAIEIARITLRLTSRASEHRPVSAATEEVYTARAIWESRGRGRPWLEVALEEVGLSALRQRGELPRVGERRPQILGGHHEVMRERGIALLEERGDPEDELVVPRVQPVERLGGPPGVERCQVAHEVIDLALQAELRDEPDGGGILQADPQAGPLDRPPVAGRRGRQPEHEAGRQGREEVGGDAQLGGVQTVHHGRRGGKVHASRSGPCGRGQAARTSTQTVWRVGARVREASAYLSAVGRKDA